MSRLDVLSIIAPTQNRRVCRFYQRGMCKFGNHCRFFHGEPRQQVEKSKSPRQASKNGTTQSASSSLASDSDAQSLAGASGSGMGFSHTDSEASSRTCGICFDTIMEKTVKSEQIFGILPNCNHCFCFACITTWRQSKEFDFDVSKACPECRKPSDYVYRSKVWFELKEEKDSFILKEKSRMQTIDCRYFKRGVAYCPFGNTCLYLHALPNGKKVDVGPPKPRKNRASNGNQMLYQLLYWLNDNEDQDVDQEEDDDTDYDFDLDLNDPEIAMQYFDHDDVRRYIALNRLVNPSSDTDSDDFEDIEMKQKQIVNTG